MRSVVLAVALALAGAPRPAVAGFAPGEEIVFDLSFLNLHTGEGRIQVGRPEGQVWPIIVQARTDGVAGLIDIREHLVSYWDSATQLPRGSDLRAYEVGDYHQDTARFDRENAEATVSVQRKGRNKVKVVPIEAEVHDLTSAFMWLRLKPLGSGERYEIPVLSGQKAFTLLAEVMNRETIETRAGTFETMKVRIRTGFDGKFSQKGDSYLWLTDDSQHVLVRASAEFAVGSIVATLKSYKPGNAVAAR